MGIFKVLETFLPPFKPFSKLLSMDK